MDWWVLGLVALGVWFLAGAAVWFSLVVVLKTIARHQEETPIPPQPVARRAH